MPKGGRRAGVSVWLDWQSAPQSRLRPRHPSAGDRRFDDHVSSFTADLRPTPIGTAGG